MDLIHSIVAANADAFSESRISVSKLSSWNRDEQLSGNLPSLQRQAVTTEAAPLWTETAILGLL